MKLALLLAIIATLFGYQDGHTPVNRPSSISGGMVSEILNAWNSPLAEHATLIYELCESTPIDCAFALAMWRKESQLASDGSPNLAFYNFHGMTCGTRGSHASGCSGRWKTYDSYEAAIRDWFEYIPLRYFDEGLTTVESIVYTYAPPSENNTQQYIDQLNQWMREWGSGTVGTAPPDAGGILDSLENLVMPDEWIDARLDALKYDMWRGISALIWAVNQGILALADLLDQLRRALIDNGFRPVIDSLAEGVLGVSRPVFTVGCMLLALALIFSPVGRMLQLINSRKLFGIILLTPAILGAGVAGAFFQDLEELRGNVGSLINQGVMEEIAPAFADLGREDTGTGQTQNVCEVLPFNPANTTRNGASIAGAFLCATRGDVLDPANPAPSELPDEFARTFFELGFAEFAQADDADREAQIANAIEGTGRMAIGFALVCFALVEALTNVLWTLGLGTLFIAAVIIWLVGWFRPYEHMLSVLSYGVLQVFTSSWILSAMYGVALAGGLAVADTRNAPLVFAAGLGLLVFGLYLLSMTAGTIAAAIKAAWNGITGGGGGPSHSGGLRWAERQLQRATQLAGGATAAAYTGATRPLRAAGNAAASTAGSVAEGWGNVAEAKLAYDTARSAGNSRTYAAVYAGSSNRKLAKIGALANAMEKTSPEAERALFTASRHRGDQLSPAAVRAVKRDARKT